MGNKILFPTKKLKEMDSCMPVQIYLTKEGDEIFLKENIGFETYSKKIRFTNDFSFFYDVNHKLIRMNIKNNVYKLLNESLIFNIEKNNEGIYIFDLGLGDKKSVNLCKLYIFSDIGKPKDNRFNDFILSNTKGVMELEESSWRNDYIGFKKGNSLFIDKENRKVYYFNDHNTNTNNTQKNIKDKSVTNNLGSNYNAIFEKGLLYFKNGEYITELPTENKIINDFNLKGFSLAQIIGNVGNFMFIFNKLDGNNKTILISNLLGKELLNETLDITKNKDIVIRNYINKSNDIFSIDSHFFNYYTTLEGKKYSSKQVEKIDEYIFNDNEQTLSKGKSYTRKGLIYIENNLLKNPVELKNLLLDIMPLYSNKEFNIETEYPTIFNENSYSLDNVVSITPVLITNNNNISVHYIEMFDNTLHFLLQSRDKGLFNVVSIQKDKDFELIIVDEKYIEFKNNGESFLIFLESFTYVNKSKYDTILGIEDKDFYYGEAEFTLLPINDSLKKQHFVGFIKRDYDFNNRKTPVELIGNQLILKEYIEGFKFEHVKDLSLYSLCTNKGIFSNKTKLELELKGKDIDSIIANNYHKRYYNFGKNNYEDLLFRYKTKKCGNEDFSIYQNFHSGNVYLQISDFKLKQIKEYEKDNNEILNFLVKGEVNVDNIEGKMLDLGYYGSLDKGHFEGILEVIGNKSKIFG